jgi:hypothetical protein
MAEIGQKIGNTVDIARRQSTLLLPGLKELHLDPGSSAVLIWWHTAVFSGMETRCGLG